ncbi:MAG: phosphatidate cytidylyltransferase [Candidatus Atribacteria bacterium]|nr:phosphatidate cytidylyltransferase [Candidatus Atribacteria bacterium]
MAEKFEKIKVRTLTIIIGLPIILMIIHQGGVLYYLTVSILAIIGYLEIFLVSRKKNFHPSFVLGLVATLFLLLHRITSIFIILDQRLIFTLIIFFIFMEHFLLSKKYFFIYNISITLFISIYIGYLLSFLIDIRLMNHGNILILFALFTTWMSDTVAYIFGILYGKRHPFPTISPNKTLEGSIAGLLGGAICGIAFSYFIPLKPLVLFVIGLLAAICGQIGDLFESMIKRNFDVKDSGNLLPGHGGVLDCMDSILFSAPFVYYIFLKLLQ